MSKKKKKKRLLIVLSSLTALSVFVLGVGIIIYQNSQQEEKKLEEAGSKIRVPRRWLYTDEINTIINKFVPEEEWDSTDGSFFIVPAGSFFFSEKEKAKKDLDNWKKQKYGPKEPEDREIIFIPVNVNKFHHSLLIYKKSNDSFYHYDSLSGYNFKYIKDNTINNGNLVEAECPQQSSDGWGSCGIYPPVIISILLKRYKENNDFQNWKITKKQFSEERDKIIELY